MLVADQTYNAQRTEQRVEQLDPRLVASGFPAAADDYAEKALNLHDHLVTNATATYFMRAGNNDYKAEGILKNDLLVIDRSQPPMSGRLAVVEVEGDLAIRRIVNHNGSLMLAMYGQIPLFLYNGNNNSILWGIITYVIHDMIDGQ